MTADPLAQLIATEGERDRDWISLNFVLGQLAPKIREAVFAAAVPHWFDFELLSTLVSQTNTLTKKDFKRLISLSFVERFPDRGYNIHESTRSLILKRLSTHVPELLRQYSREAAKYFHSARKLGDSWLIEEVYHLTVTGDASFLDVLDYGQTFQMKYKHGETETLCRTILECRQFIKLPKEILAACYSLIGTSYDHFGKTSSAKDAIRSALNLKVDNDAFNADCWADLAGIEYTLDERLLALRHYSKALAFYDQEGDDYFVADCLLHMAGILWLEKKQEKAISNANRALKRFSTVKAVDGVARCYNFLGMVALERGRFKLAGDRYNTALKYARDARAIMTIIISSVGLAEVEIERRDFPSARKLIISALRKANKIKSAPLYAEARIVDALLEYNLARYDKAEKKALEAAKLFEEVEDRHRESDAWDLLAVVYESMNELEKALDCTVKARRLFQAASKRTLPRYADHMAELKRALRLQKKRK